MQSLLYEGQGRALSSAWQSGEGPPFNVDRAAFTPGETGRMKNEIPEAGKYGAHR